MSKAFFFSIVGFVISHTGRGDGGRGIFIRGIIKETVVPLLPLSTVLKMRTVDPRGHVSYSD